MATVKVRIENLDRTIEAEVGDNLRSALLNHNVPLYVGIHNLINCRGKGLCGTCVVDVVEGPGLSDLSLYEKLRAGFTAGKRASNPRLACMTRCYQDATIRTLTEPPSD
jgi:ferredoxin